MREKCHAIPVKRVRRAVATATAFTVLCQNFAWAVCADGSMFPPGGFVGGQPPAVNWSPGVFTSTAGSIFVADNSVFEQNDPAQPLTGGGHNWAFDQSAGTCKATDTGPAGGAPTAWAIPNTLGVDCLLLPIIRNGIIVAGPFDIPYQGTTITPTCNPALLSQPGAPNPANTRLNQLGCAISHAVATTPQSTTTFLFVAGINSGLFAIPLANVTNPVTGGEAGKIIDTPSGPVPTYYSDIPVGQKLTNAAVSPDGMFAIATSMKRLQPIFACLNPLGDPGDPSLPIDPNFSIPPASQVKCMQVGVNGLGIDLTTAFGPDNQPYFAGRAGASGQNNVTSFNADPGGSAATAWPQCIFFASGFTNLQAAFNAHSANHCGTARPNVGFPAATVVQPAAFITHGSYLYVDSGRGAVLQFKVSVNPVSGLSQYVFRTYISGLSQLSLLTGLGVADDLLSLMVFTDPSGGVAGGEAITKVPLCEDM